MTDQEIYKNTVTFGCKIFVFLDYLQLISVQYKLYSLKMN